MVAHAISTLSPGCTWIIESIVDKMERGRDRRLRYDPDARVPLGKDTTTVLSTIAARLGKKLFYIEQRNIHDSSMGMEHYSVLLEAA